MNFSEERIIEMLKESNLPNGVLGIGDDCAVIPNNANNSWLISTDALVEDVHFSISTISPKDLGSKAISVNISDVAAMGGTPKFVFISCAIPDHLDNVFMKRFISGIKEQTITQKILSKAANRKFVDVGESIWLNVDILLTHDVCGPPTQAVRGRIQFCRRKDSRLRGYRDRCQWTNRP